MIDTTIYCTGEEHILELRLRHLWDCIDRFVIVEADRYYSGTPKEVVFPQQNFKWAQSKIEFRVATLSPNGDNLSREIAHRNTILDVLNDLDLPDGTPIFHSDVDEIPKGDLLRTAVQCLKGSTTPIRLFMNIHERWLDNRLHGRIWEPAVVAAMSQIRRLPGKMHELRNTRWSGITDAGWHFQHVRSEEEFLRRRTQGTHADPGDPNCDLTPFLTAPERVMAAYSDPDFDIFREHHQRNVSYERIPIIEEYLPSEIVNNREKYQKWIYQR